MRGVDGERVGRRGHRDEARARTRRAARGQTRRAGVHRTAGDDDGVTARIFMGVEARTRKRSGPDRGRVLEDRRRDLGKHIVVDADVGDDDLAAESAARQQHMARLLAEEGDGERRFKRDAAHLARVARQTARHIDGDDGHALARRAFVETADQLARDAVDIAREAGAENRVDNEERALARFRRQRVNRDRTSATPLPPRRRVSASRSPSR